MKRIISICLVLLMTLISSASVSAAAVDNVESGITTVTIDNWTYERIDGDAHWRIVDYVGEDTELIVPRIVNDVMVVSLGSYSFANDTTVTSVETSSPLWTVEEYAFYCCTSLQSFECNFALKNIGVGAFLGTSSLKNINLEDSIVEVISSNAFMNSGIEQVALPDTCVELSNNSFAQCHQLIKVEIPDSVTTIHQDAFRSSENVVIYATKESYAIEYAIENNIPYVITNPDPEPMTFLLGDADHDGVISVLDATIIQKCLASIIADEDGWIHIAGSVDGLTLNISHATYIQKYLACITVPYEIGTEVTRVVES